MVKRQKEKQYQSAREQRDYGKTRSGGGSVNPLNHGTVQKTLPFSCCALTLTPFQVPVCTIVDDTHHPMYAVVFDNAALMEYVLQHKKDPVTGKPLQIHRIIRLTMDRDTEGRWQCPILTKPFADHSKIVAVLNRHQNDDTTTTPILEAHVYSYEAYHELNVKTKNWTDLTTGVKFHPKKDVLLLNDPNDLQFQSKRDISTFWHTTTHHHQNERTNHSTTTSNSNILKSVTATRIMEQLEKQKQEKQKQKLEQQTAAQQQNDETQLKPSMSLYDKAIHSQRNYTVLAKDVTGMEYTEGKTAGSLTSTSMAVSHQTADRQATEEEIMQSYFRILKTKKKGDKGYVKMVLQFEATSKPKQTVELLIELHCDIAPRTCMNFIGLCRDQRYNGTLFHRIIPHFMMQGGKAIDGAKDESYWGGAFPDEFDDRLKHTQAGILSMANSGPNTNLQQFFITLHACPHLDRKHSVFGQVVDGMDRVMDHIIRHIQTDKKDRPVDASIAITQIEIIDDPIQDVQQKEDERLRQIAKARNDTTQTTTTATTKRNTNESNTRNSNISTSSNTKLQQTMGRDKPKVGKYLTNVATISDVVTDDLVLEQNTTAASSFRHSATAQKRPTTTVTTSNPKKPKFGDFSSW
ncbi:peptidyl-prolyl cis-trans isomerase A [Nitzschia inconspicua]|uniref:Peptidyl-prolyl cis-trans isomerase A n=1 Tax=Nitzschia inconspicua TaxID=303405 RepID=A0A9K3M666_9STRA|nr:peptidyl-prolyl cis-trans isomerase A [Nitzschia inconspicua]KAG7372826.1 peptidyl-prolyl cis-trans isomerase A [Nitzschia inconspicua]